MASFICISQGILAHKSTTAVKMDFAATLFAPGQMFYFHATPKSSVQSSLPSHISLPADCLGIPNRTNDAPAHRFDKTKKSPCPPTAPAMLAPYAYHSRNPKFLAKKRQNLPQTNLKSTNQGLSTFSEAFNEPQHRLTSHWKHLP